jgi:hypothetical protein
VSSVLVVGVVVVVVVVDDAPPLCSIGTFHVVIFG